MVTGEALWGLTPSLIILLENVWQNSERREENVWQNSERREENVWQKSERREENVWQNSERREENGIIKKEYGTCTYCI